MSYVEENLIPLSGWDVIEYCLAEYLVEDESGKLWRLGLGIDNTPIKIDLDSGKPAVGEFGDICTRYDFEEMLSCERLEIHGKKREIFLDAR